MAGKYKKRPDGRYQTKVYLGSENGKQKYKYLYAISIKELERKAEDLRYTLHKGGKILSGDLPFQAWAERFLRLKKNNVNDKGYNDISAQVNFWINVIGDLPISKIVCSDLQAPLDKLASYNPHTKRPTAQKTLIDYRRAVSNVFKLAIADRAITYNPAEYIIQPKGAKKKERRALTDEEQRWIVSTPHRAQTAAMIMMLAGLRRGEVIPLRVNDIDLDAGTLSVNKSVTMINGRPSIKDGGKTENAERTVNIPTQLISYLRPLLSDRSPLALVCPDTKGRIMTESAFKRMWESYLKDLNFAHGKFDKKPSSKFDPAGVPFVIEKITPHMLRHTCATNMILAGMDVVTVRDQLGHADIQTTLNIYAHVTGAHKASEIDKLDSFLKAKSIV